MVTLPIYNRQGEQVGQYQMELTELAPRISKQLLHDAVVMYQANRRQGTAKSKARSEVAGSTKKMYRQKGTGRARAGSRRSPVRRGGGHTHAIRPRDWSYRLPKKAIRLATRMAVASRLRDGEVALIDQLSFQQPRTREAAAVLKALKLDQMRVLVVLEQYDATAYKSLRNVRGISVLPVSELNALEVLRPRRLLITVAAMDRMCGRVPVEVAGAGGSTEQPPDRLGTVTQEHYEPE